LICGAAGVIDSNCPVCHEAAKVTVLKAQLQAYEESDPAEVLYPVGTYVHSGSASAAGSIALVSSFGIQGASTTGVVYKKNKAVYCLPRKKGCPSCKIVEVYAAPKFQPSGDDMGDLSADVNVDDDISLFHNFSSEKVFMAKDFIRFHPQWYQNKIAIKLSKGPRLVNTAAHPNQQLGRRPDCSLTRCECRQYGSISGVGPPRGGEEAVK
jgi:hypothetical protein